MKDNSSAKGLVQRYGLEPPPESVVQLTALVARQDASAEEIAKVVAKDKAISARLLRYANPSAESEQEYDFTTVEDALLRTGMAPVILLAMLDPLTRAVIKASDMFQMPFVPTPLEKLAAFPGSHVLATVKFAGQASGVVNLRLTSDSARRFAAAIGGVTPEEMTDIAEIEDAIGEFLNIIAGNLQSNLCDSGIPCKLASPHVSHVTNFQKATLSGGVSERLGFTAGDITVFVDVNVNPWSD